MKKSLILIVITLLGYTASAQVLTGQTYIQKTVMGMQKGFGFRVQTNKGLGLGFIHQSNLKRDREATGSSYSLYGVEAVVPLTKCGNMRFYFSPKAGFVNERFFIIIPELETEIRITNRISTAITAGIRARESATGLKIMVHL